MMLTSVNWSEEEVHSVTCMICCWSTLQEENLLEYLVRVTLLAVYR